MRRKKIWSIVLLCFLLVLSTFPFEVLAANSTWYNFGQTRKRERITDDGMTKPPLYYKWAMNLGWSISQPIHVGDFFYHFAGGIIFKIPINMDFHPKGEAESTIYQDFISKGGKSRFLTSNYEGRSQLSYSVAYDTLFVGTGNDRVYALDPVTLKSKGWIQTSGGRLVSAPTPIVNGTLAIADANANLRLYKDLYKGVTNKSTIVSFRDGDSSITITGSPAVHDNRMFIPITYSAKNKEGRVVAIDVSKSGSKPSVSLAWQFKTRNGVATSTVYRDGVVYFSDKSGGMYAVNANNGKLIWQNQQHQTGNNTVTLVNNSPSIVGNYIVVPYRYMNGRGSGRIVAFDARNGSTRWVHNPGVEVANSPTIIRESRNDYYVLFGTTDGYLHVLDLFTGNRRTITHDYNGKPQQKVRVVSSSGEGSFFPGMGLATETMPAAQHLLVGGNSGSLPNSSGTNGYLFAYSAGLPNLKIHDIRTRPSEPNREGDIIIEAQVENESGRAMTTNMGWRIQNGSIQKTGNFTLQANERKWVRGPTIKAGTLSDDATVLQVWAKINPDENKPDNEETYSDNAMTKNFPLYGGIDLYTDSVTGGKYFETQKLLTRVNVGRMNKGEAPNTDTKVRLTLRNKENGSTRTLGEQSVSLVRGQARSLYFEWTADRAGDYELIAEINPSRSIKETTYSNNIARAPLTVWDKQSAALCGVSPSGTYGITGTFQYQGNARWNEDRERWEYETLTGYYYEHLHASYKNKPEGSFVDDDGNIERQGTNVVEAGQGFNFEIESEYVDESGRYSGPRKAHMEVPDGTRSDMDHVYPAGSDYNEWRLSQAWVERNGYEVKYQQNKPHGEWLDGGRAFYTPMDTQDGPYPFTVKVYEAGRNNLEMCMEGEVIVDGMLYDDFYVRRVYPGNPFPFGVTPMWEGHEHLLTDLLDWYEGRE